MATDESPTPLKNSFLIIATSVVASGAMASSCFFSRAESVARTANGLLPQNGSGLNELIAVAYRLSGWQGADWTRAVAVFLPCLILFAVIGLLALRLSSRPLGILFLIVSLSALAWGVNATIQSRRNDIRDLRLLAPVGLFEAAAKTDGRIFVNPSAYAHAALLAPGSFARIPNPEMIGRMCSSLALWREEDRTEPFSALIFTGNRIADMRPMIEGLSSDWHLARTDNHGLLFLRGTPPKEISTNESASSFKDPRSQAIFLSQSALVLDVIERQAEARKMMEKSLEIFPADASVLVNSAMLAASQKRWTQVQKNASAALKLTPDSVQARYLLALALLETNSISKAAIESTRLLGQQPYDPQVLQLQARVSRANNDSTAEIDALERLLSLEKKEHQDTSPIHIYLGQAWARKGFATQALANYEIALQGNLSPVEKTQIQSAIQNIRQKSGPTQKVGP